MPRPSAAVPSRDEWRTALDDCLGYPTPWCSRSLELGSDYFTFADKLDTTLRGIGRRQVREAEEQAAIILTFSSIPDVLLAYG